MRGAGLCSSRMLEVATHPSPLGWRPLTSGGQDGREVVGMDLHRRRWLWFVGRYLRGRAAARSKGSRAGDIVYTPADQWHWHGAAPGHFMTHLSITEAVPGDQRPEA